MRGRCAPSASEIKTPTMVRWQQRRRVVSLVAADTFVWHQKAHVCTNVTAGVSLAGFS